MYPCTAKISRLSRTTHQNIQRPLTASGLFFDTTAREIERAGRPRDHAIKIVTCRPDRSPAWSRAPPGTAKSATCRIGRTGELRRAERIERGTCRPGRTRERIRTGRPRDNRQGQEQYPARSRAPPAGSDSPESEALAFVPIEQSTEIVANRVCKITQR
jgi:hypothetical protein